MMRLPRLNEGRHREASRLVRAGVRIGGPSQRDPWDPRPVGYSPEPFPGASMRGWAQVSACPLRLPEPGIRAQLPHLLEAVACEAIGVREMANGETVSIGWRMLQRHKTSMR
jgi:hypothetical protein